VKEIPLTQGYVALVDDDDYEELSKYKWHVDLQRSGPKAKRNSLVSEGEGQKAIYMHRQIMYAPAGTYVDYKDHDTLNNQRVNLRPCTRSQNAANQRPQEGCSSRFKGVYWHKAARKWHAAILVEGKRKYLGLFVDEVRAAQEYNKAALQHFKEFALLNVI